MKEQKINIPEGCEIYKENSTFECIKFKKIPEAIIKWDNLNFAVEICNGEEHFLISAKSNMMMSWDDAMRHFKDNPTWKLPTRKQLQIIHEHLEKINNLIEEIGGYKIFGWFWTYEEKDKFCAWFVGMDDGYTGSLTKRYYRYVRAVSIL